MGQEGTSSNLHDHNDSLLALSLIWVLWQTWRILEEDNDSCHNTYIKLASLISQPISKILYDNVKVTILISASFLMFTLTRIRSHSSSFMALPKGFFAIFFAFGDSAICVLYVSEMENQQSESNQLEKFINVMGLICVLQLQEGLECLKNTFLSVFYDVCREMEKWRNGDGKGYLCVRCFFQGLSEIFENICGLLTNILSVPPHLIMCILSPCWSWVVVGERQTTSQDPNQPTN
jgi:hypothetical protein